MPEEAAISRAQKDAVRRLALFARSRIAADVRTGAGAAVAASVIALPEIVGATTVLAFASFGAEIPTDELLARLLAAEKRVVLPYVDDGGAMGVAAISSLDDVVAGYRGIREPAARDPVSNVEAAVVPGVAFDVAGGRLGYGGGFFDRFLASLDGAAPLIGVCFDAQIVEEVPLEEHDRKVDLVVTEKRVVRCR